MRRLAIRLWLLVINLWQYRLRACATASWRANRFRRLAREALNESLAVAVQFGGAAWFVV